MNSLKEKSWEEQAMVGLTRCHSFFYFEQSVLKRDARCEDDGLIRYSSRIVAYG